MDGEKKIQLQKYAGNSHSLINTMIDFNVIIETREYFGYMDILSILGGHKTSILTILTSLSPFFFALFMIKLAKII